MKNILNYRKVAEGQKNKDGKELKNIYRSADVSFASQADMALLLESGIKNIIDLRSDEEINAHPQLSHEQIRVQQIDIIGDGAQNEVQNFKLNELNNYMIELYKTKFVETDGFKQELEYIFNLDGAPFLFHCTAGKDRTGITGAILMQILGFSEEQIKQEYLTIDSKLVDFITQKFISGFLSDETQEVTDEIKSIASVRLEFIDGFYTGVKSEYGNFDNFIEKKLGINEEKKEILRKSYLV